MLEEFDLNLLPVVDLKAIAKEYKIKRYSRLGKQALISHISAIKRGGPDFHSPIGEAIKSPEIIEIPPVLKARPRKRKVGHPIFFVLDDVRYKFDSKSEALRYIATSLPDLSVKDAAFILNIRYQFAHNIMAPLRM